MQSSSSAFNFSLVKSSSRTPPNKKKNGNINSKAKTVNN